MKNLLWVLPLFISLLVTTNSSAQVNCIFNTTTGQWESQDGGPCVNTILTSVPFLRVAVDARSGGMGEAGIAISPDANAMHYNESKLAFSDKKSSIALNLKPFQNDINLFYLTGYNKLSDKDVVGIGVRYFALGTIEFFDSVGVSQNRVAKEIEIEASYSRQLSKNFAVGIGVKYIHSNLGVQQFGDITIGPGNSFAADLSMTYYNDQLKFLGKKTDLTIGAALSNFGQKISYTNTINSDFIPTNLGLGAAWKINAADNHSITFAFDANKLLVPTPSFVDEDGINGPDYRTKNMLEGMLDSFNDAPGGTKEELRELQYSMGLEYWWKQKLAIRTGYFSEHETKGNRKYYTVGIGSRYKGIGFDLSLEIPQVYKRDVFERTLRFTMMYDFSSKKELATID